MYEFRTQPWEHQKACLRASWKREGFARLMEMGTGKSKVAVDEASLYYEEKLIDAWVVIPPKGVYENWTRKEIPEHMPQRVLDKALIVRWGAAGGRVQAALLSEALRPRDGLVVLVMNVEALSSPGAARDYLEAFLKAHRCLVDIDESTKIKNPSAKRTKALVRLGALAEYRRINTGSPVTRSPLDLYAQFEFLGPGLLGSRSFYAFRSRYAVLQDRFFGGRRVAEVVGYQNLDLLTEKMRAHSFRVTKEECLDLPPKIYETRDVELTPEQKRLYEEIRDYALTTLENGEMVSAQAVIVQIIRLHQIVCGFVGNDDGDVRDIPSRRIEVLEDVLEETDGKVVVWCRYRRAIDQIVGTLSRSFGPENVAQFHGGNVSERNEEAQRFLTDPACRYMVATQAAGGYGNTWTAANTEIYFANDYDLELRLQSEDRLHRAGQHKPVTIIDLVARGTVDEKILAALRNKLNLAAQVVGDGYREWLT